MPSCLGIFLSLRYEYPVIFFKLRQAVRNQIDSVQVVNPTTLSVGPSCDKLFWREADDLIKELAACISVIVLGHDLALRWLARKQITHLKSDLLDDCFYAAPTVTV